MSGLAHVENEALTTILAVWIGRAGCRHRGDQDVGRDPQRLLPHAAPCRQRDRSW
jgi:hypothetical protein